MAAVAAAAPPATSPPSTTRPAPGPRDVVPAPVVVPVGADATVLPTDTTFAALGVPAPLVEVLTASGITSPFPIQVATLPDSLAGRDVLGRGRTGSGKTLAFSLPLVARLAASDSKRQPKRPRSLILVPTRELANQVAAVVDPLARALGMKTTTIFGGVGQNPQVQALAGGLDVVIACPGRLEDLIQQGHCDLGADRGHHPRRGRPHGRPGLPARRQADHGPHPEGRPADAVLGHAGQRRRRPGQALPEQPDDALGRPGRRAGQHHDPPRVPRRRRRQGAGSSRSWPSGLGRSVLFTRTKHQAKKLAKQLTAAGVPAVDLHGNLSQNARERNLEAFTTGTTRVLCATDIAARGIHVDDVAIVVHVDPPAEHKAYLHRSGRTARAGAEGAVVTIATPDQAGEVRTLARQAGITPEVSAIKPGAREITALTGPAAPYVEPAPVVEQPQGNGGGRRRRGGSGRSASGGAASSGGRSSSGGAAKSGGSGRASGPARTRAELAARAGSSSAASFSSPSRRGSR